MSTQDEDSCLSLNRNILQHSACPRTEALAPSLLILPRFTKASTIDQAIRCCHNGQKISCNPSLLRLSMTYPSSLKSVLNIPLTNAHHRPKQKVGEPSYLLQENVPTTTIKSRPLLFSIALSLDAELRLVEALINQGCKAFGHSLVHGRNHHSTNRSDLRARSYSPQTANGFPPSLRRHPTFSCSPRQIINNTEIFHVCERSDGLPSLSSNGDGLGSYVSDDSADSHDKEDVSQSGTYSWDDPPIDISSRHSTTPLHLSCLTPQRVVTQFKKCREQLCKKWFHTFNDTVFKKRIPSTVVVEWNSRLTRTAGQTLMTTIGGVPQVRIHLSPRVIDKEERLQTTLLHEMCHAAQFLLEGEQQPAHGPGFQKWAARASAKWPNIRVTVTHNYTIHFPKRYQCVACGHVYGRYTKLKNLETATCKKPGCVGSLVFLGHFKRDPTNPYKPEPTRELTPYNRFIKERFNQVKSRMPMCNNKIILRQLVEEWRVRKLPSITTETTPLTSHRTTAVPSNCINSAARSLQAQLERLAL